MHDHEVPKKITLICLILLTKLVKVSQTEMANKKLGEICEILHFYENYCTGLLQTGPGKPQLTTGPLFNKVMVGRQDS